MGPHKPKKVCTSKGINNSMKRKSKEQCRMIATVYWIEDKNL